GRARVRAGPAVFPSALLGYSCGEVVTDRGAGAHCVAPGLEVGRHCGLDLSGRLGDPQVFQHDGGRQHRGGGVGLALAGDVGCGAVYRLEHARERTVGVDVAAGGQSAPPGDGGTDVGDDVTEQVVGDHHVEAGGLIDQEHRRGVDVSVVHGHLRVLFADLPEHAL